MSRLKQALQRRYQDGARGNIQILTPLNGETVALALKAEKVAKVVGKLASEDLKDSELVSGLMVCKDFNYTLMAPEDLHNYTQITSASINQKLTVWQQSVVRFCWLWE